MTEEDILKIKSRTSHDELECLGAPSEGPCLSHEAFAEILKWEKNFTANFSIPIKEEELQAAYQRGMLKKDQLEDGKYYWGICRNARVARWSKKDGVFFYNRWKGNWTVKRIPHPVDEEIEEGSFGRLLGLDIFIPWLEVTPLPHEGVRFSKKDMY